MHWPYIFFKAGKKGASPEPTPDASAERPPTPSSAEPQPPAIQPVPAAIGSSTAPVPPEQPKTDSQDSGTRTLPAMHGLVLRPPNRTTLSSGALPIGGASSSARSTAPLKNIQQLMAEADPMHTLNQTSNVHLMKRPPTVTQPTNVAPATPAPPPSMQVSRPENPPITPLVTKSTPMPTSPVLPPPKAPTMDPASIPPPFPSFKPAAAAAPDIKLPETVKVARPSEPMTKTAAPLSPAPPFASTPKPLISANAASTDEIDSPFILKPATGSAQKAATPIPQPPPPPTPTSMGSIFRRKAKLTEVARIVLPPRREDTQPLMSAPSSSPTVVPPAFPVAAMTKRASQPIMGASIAAQMPPPPPLARVVTEKIVPESKAPEPSPTVELPKEDATPLPLDKVIEAPFIEAKPIIDVKPAVTTETVIEKKEIPVAAAPKAEILPQEIPAPIFAKSETAKLPENSAIPEPIAPPATPPTIPPPLPTTGSLFPETPKVDPEAHKPESSAAPLPKVDPEAHQPATAPLPKIEPEAPKPEPTPAPPIMQISAPEPLREKKEFHLANGERVAGVVLSETPEAVLVEHASLGVISVPRNQIAKRLVEIILINGDRIVGDIMAETADTLYVRHASLGMLTVPRAQRSTRVVEAILKDGDRILGEVLTETDSFTVIRSATLGTITVPHGKIAMLNRKIEQIEMKTLPPPAPELKDKSS